MQKISLLILAGGRGNRFRPLTDTIPKPLIKINGQSSLGFTISNLGSSIDEVVVVVGYLDIKIKDSFGDNFNGLPIKYVFQKEQKGTAHAVYSAKDKIKNDQLVIVYGDDLYGKNILTKIPLKINAVAGIKSNNWRNTGVLKLKNGYLDKIIEKPQEFVGDLVNIGVYHVNRDIFSYFKKIKLSIRGEYEFTDMMSLYAKETQVEVVQFDGGWMPLSYPWNILDVAEKQLEDVKSEIEGVVEKGARIKGNLILEQGALIKDGAYLEGNFYVGRNSVIGPNCYLKGFGSIGENVVIGNGVEITRSVIGDNCNIRHLSYVGDSILGEGVNIGGGSVIANLRHDGENITVNINGQRIDSGRKKLGAIIGANSKIGINNSIYPGVKIASGSKTLPGAVIKEDG